MEFSADSLRQRNRKLRAELSKVALEKAASRLFDQVCALPEFLNAQKIATYSAVNGEISLNLIIDRALELGKQIYLPNLDLKSLRFSPYFHGQKMRINRFKLPEPDVSDDEMLAPEDLDLVFVDGSAFLEYSSSSKNVFNTINDMEKRHPEFLKSIISFSAEIERMGLHREPALVYASKKSFVQSYRTLFNEIVSITAK